MAINLLITEATNTPFARHVHDWVDTGIFNLLVPADGSERNLCELAPQANAILCYQSRLTAVVLQAAPRLRFIQKHGLNVRNIDVTAATALNIPVATMPLMRNLTVAEHAMAMMLACSRKIIDGHHAVTQAAYRELELTPTPTTQSQYRANWAQLQGMNELYQATVGIAGMGDIGMEIARRCRAFGMRIVYHQQIGRAHV